LFFNTVWYPEEASLRYLPPARLQEILDYVGDVHFPNDSDVQRTNKSNYLDLIHQIEAFRDKTVVPDYDHFDDMDIASSRWSLRAVAGNAAEFTIASTEPGVVRVAIQKAATQAPWEIQLNRAPLAVESNRHYMLSFRARARKPRSMGFGIADAHGAKEDLGKHKYVRLTTEWQTFQMVFGPLPRGGDARIHFGLGGDADEVEIGDLGLRTLAVAPGSSRRDLEPGERR
jgi:hypothetical protein